jgi:hypothetical protein
MSVTRRVMPTSNSSPSCLVLDESRFNRLRRGDVQSILHDEHMKVHNDIPYQENSFPTIIRDIYKLMGCEFNLLIIKVTWLMSLIHCCMTIVCPLPSLVAAYYDNCLSPPISGKANLGSYKQCLVLLEDTGY